VSDLNILHVDMDAFFAAVEQRDNPELIGKAVIIGGVELDRRGVVSTASYEARKYGVYSAMTIARAKKLCPHGIYLPGRHDRYQEFSKKIIEILYEFTPRVEQVSIDEAFLDLKGCHRLFGTSREIGEKIKMRINEKTNLKASVGIASNKFLAKLASDLDKPDGFTVIERNRVNQILDPLPVKKIWGVGQKTEKIIKRKGIRTIKDLKSLSKKELIAYFGKSGKRLFYLARGIDNRELEMTDTVKSISHEETFRESISAKNDIFSVLFDLSERVARRLRKQNLVGQTVFVKIRYNNFKTLTRRLSLAYPVNSSNEIYKIGRELLIKDSLLEKPVRLLGIGIGKLSYGKNVQVSLFGKKDLNELNKAIDNIKDKYGEKSIRHARTLIYNDRNSN